MTTPDAPITTSAAVAEAPSETANADSPQAHDETNLVVESGEGSKQDATTEAAPAREQFAGQLQEGDLSPDQMQHLNESYLGDVQTEKRRPRLAEAVIYSAPTYPFNDPPEPQAAIVTRVLGDDVVSVRILHDDDVMPGHAPMVARRGIGIEGTEWWDFA